MFFQQLVESKMPFFVIGKQFIRCANVLQVNCMKLLTALNKHTTRTEFRGEIIDAGLNTPRLKQASLQVYTEFCFELVSPHFFNAVFTGCT
jgi:hypothetical protein